MTYKGFEIERTEAVQFGYKLPNSRSIGKQVGIGNSRKVVCWIVWLYGRSVTTRDTLKEAKKYCDNYGE